MRLRPLEYVYLLVALAIVAQQLVIRRGIFDPLAVATVMFFIGLVPASRVDRRATEGEEASPDTPLQRLIRALVGERR